MDKEDTIRLKAAEPCDISAWMKLSREYDNYIRETGGNLTAWYEGDGKDDAFDEYMNRKIRKREAFMALDCVSNSCLGIIAISKANNRITFFGVSRDADFSTVSNLLINCALEKLDTSREISVNIVDHKAEIFRREREAFKNHGFAFAGMTKENSIAVEVYCRKGD